MSGFTKLFSDIILSSVWSEDDKTRIVWVTLLAISNADGFVSGSVPGLAAAARVSVAECDTALQKLASSDPHSRTKDHEGRRIEAVDGGWLILNYRAYRDRRSDDPNAIKTRERVRRYRDRQSLPLDPHPGTAEAEDRSRSSVALRNVTDGFEEFWEAYPRKVGRTAAEKAFAKLPDPVATLPLILAALAWQRQSPQWKDPQYIPHPSTYLNGKRWTDQPEKARGPLTDADHQRGFRKQP